MLNDYQNVMRQQALVRQQQHHAQVEAHRRNYEEHLAREKEEREYLADDPDSDIQNPADVEIYGPARGLAKF